MSRRVLVLGTIGFACLIGVYTYIAFQQPIPAIASTPTITHSDTTNSIINWPGSTEAAVGAVGYGVLAANGASTALPTASVAKMMVALSVLKVKPLQLGEQGPTLTLTQADVNSYNAYVAEDGSVVKVAAGEKISEYQALEAMLLPSANNMADTLATWAFGSISAYSTYANNLAESLGMSDTTFGSVDASGYSPTTISTPHDLVVLGEATLKNPVIAQIVGRPTAVVPVGGTVTNVNWLLGSYGIDGIKTGNTDQAGGVYLFSAKQTFETGQSVTIVGAIMGAPTLQAALDDAVPLLISIKAHFQLDALVQAGQIVGQYSVPWAGKVNVVAARTFTAITWQGQKITPRITLDALHAPLVKGAQVGSISFSTATKTTIPITLEQSVPTPTWKWRLLHAF